MIPQKHATSLGLMAILIWSFGALLYALLLDLPTAQILSIAFSAGFCLSLIKITVQKKWQQMIQPWPVWFFGLIGIVGYNVTFASSSKFAPIEHAMLIASCAPLLIILLAALFLKERFQVRYLCAAVLGFIGLYVLITQGKGLGHIEIQYLLGYALAFSSALSLAFFTIGLRNHNVPPDMIGLFCGVGALLSIVTHFSTEVTIPPTLSQWFYLISLGVLIHWLANIFWMLGVRQGDMKRLNLTLYTIPVLSAFWLVLFGKTQVSTPLIVAIALIVSASLLAIPRQQKNKR